MTKRNIIKDLSLSEISGVTIPAQSHALVSIMKSGETVELVKYLSTDEGAKTFSDFMADEAIQRRKNDISNELWPVMDALRNSVTSIKLDASLNDAERSERISDAVAQFDATVKGGMQHGNMGGINADGLLKSLTEHEELMSEDIAKKAAELEAQVAALTKSLADASVLAKMSDKERAYMSQLDDEAAEEFRAAAKEKRDSMMKKSADADEVFKSADGTEIRKSAVGNGIFEMLKSQDKALRDAIAKMAEASDRANTVELTKRADDEFKHLPGETVAKVAVLKGLGSLDDAAKATLEAMLKAGNDALAPAFKEIGKSGGKPSDITKAAKRDELVTKYMEANPNVSKAQAGVAVISANPDLYEG